jgi:hypothetical protein
LVATRQASQYLQNGGVHGGQRAWATVTATVSDRVIIDRVRTPVAISFDGSQTAKIELYWTDYVDDTDDLERARMRARGLYGFIDAHQQEVAFVAPYMTIRGDRYKYDVALTCELVGQPGDER